MGLSRLINRNVTALHGRTSMRLEPEMWNALEEICRREEVTLADLVRRVERSGHPGGRTSAVRVYVLTYFRRAAADRGHGDAGHGDSGDKREDGWTRPQSTGTLASV